MWGCAQGARKGERRHVQTLKNAARMGKISRVAEVALTVLDDGLGRGLRQLEFRAGTGFRFTMLVDLAAARVRRSAVGCRTRADADNRTRLLLARLRPQGGIATCPLVMTDLTFNR